MHISKLVDYVKNEISFSKEFCKDNVFITLRIEPILKILENLEQSHKDILQYVKDIEKKDKMIDLMAEELKKHIFVLYDGDTITSKKGIIEHYERKATNDG